MSPPNYLKTPASASRRWKNRRATCASIKRTRRETTCFIASPRSWRHATATAYLEVMNLLFETYSRQMEPMLATVAGSLPIEQVEVRDPTSGKALSYEEAKQDEKLSRWAETAYRATVRAQACDVLRSYLPAATLTNVGLFGVGQAFEYLLSKLLFAAARRGEGAWPPRCKQNLTSSFRLS